ncbi:Inner membrane ABC transporter permease protein ydcV [uncultured Ruminococcus sp.]|uniref:ABC transporter permease n=1 Tax=Massiliimalia timonensis TaxID=1987501 RepID=A0A8J6TS21_9FIRM|nr:ABC transporter permease [Massiliimalia timonensis]MBC8611861.1 ABC transporter permease [Massiliimalia timonensis]SCH54883.1 Inner membrane ABC transporter permease protein ydcV [uncultured Clostridium sp.]SCH66101.1 Inner membrane ABC transporter permease protein ydcV [uncultured Ruminococcus sp.]
MKKVVSKGYIYLVLLFLYAPIFVLIVFSFNESKSRANFTDFTFKWYQELFRDELIMTSLGNTLLVAVLAAVFATVLGTAAALGMKNMKKRARGLCMNLTYMPVINPEIVTGISMMLLFVYISHLFDWELGMITVLIAHITFCVPYVILNVLPKLRQMDQNTYEAALDLGCTPFSAFFKVVVPEIMPGIMAGFLMAFTFSLDDFIITYFTNGSDFQTLPVTIYAMTRKKVNPKINALSTILFLAVLIILIIMNVRQARAMKNKEK